MSVVFFFLFFSTIFSAIIIYLPGYTASRLGLLLDLGPSSSLFLLPRISIYIYTPLGAHQTLYFFFLLDCKCLYDGCVLVRCFRQSSNFGMSDFVSDDYFISHLYASEGCNFHITSRKEKEPGMKPTVMSWCVLRSKVLRNIIHEWEMWDTRRANGSC